MAELNNRTSTRNKHPASGRRKRKSTRIDMTAMVDVAFLLLTFFVLSKYKHLVDLLDELAIVEAKKFAIAPFTAADSLLLASVNVPVSNRN